MESSLLSTRAIVRKRVIGELIRGRKFAQELEVLLCNSPESDDIHRTRMASAQVLVKRILDSYSRNLSNIGSGASDKDSQVPAVDSPSLDGRRKSEDSVDSRTTCVLKDRRGSYKRRRTTERCIRVTPTWIDDGHAWRKYGQKTIQNTSHPRSYFRCTHKFEQGCLATKHVQQIQDNPPKFKTTYYDHHTCNNPYRSTPQVVIVDPTTEDNKSNIMWNFETPIDEPHYQRNDLVKQVANDNSRPSDYFISSDHLANFGQTNEALTAFSSGSDHGDVYSCTTSTHSTDMDHLIVGPPFHDDDFLEY